MKLEMANTLVLGCTLLVLIWYAVDTHRIANQTVEVNLKPVILRSGWIEDWKVQSIEEANSLGKAELLEFTNLKNIAKDISGYIILDHKKYPLSFGNEASKEVVGDKSKNLTHLKLVPTWGWLPANSRVYAGFEREKFTETREENQIYLQYQDIEGNGYFTREDANFSQNSGRR